MKIKTLFVTRTIKHIPQINLYSKQHKQSQKLLFQFFTKNNHLFVQTENSILGNNTTRLDHSDEKKRKKHYIRHNTNKMIHCRNCLHFLKTYNIQYEI